MASALNPHHVVALMVKSIGVNHEHGQRHAKLEGAAMIGRMLEDDEGNGHTFSIMDAFVKICVSDPNITLSP